ncbi:MAG: 7-cyano-7-deazaguanine synthase QueC [Candidatus Sericytochromatia bacterium]|nr:7-cyano-7-deazaguanine synthase QueC [Candidatus Sericytochromatia bacterium]
MTRNIILLSGGLDSATCAYIAKEAGDEIYALSFDYGQRHTRELDAARAVAAAVRATEHLVMRFDLRLWGGSALTSDMAVPMDRDDTAMAADIPVTYVPGRNTIFLAFAMSYAEAKGASKIYLGINALDYSGYPDCRPEYLAAFQEVARLGTKVGTEGHTVELVAPLMHWDKAGIIKAGLAVGTNYALTWSCYQGGDTPCGRCDSCLLRAKGFAEAGLPDPA